MQRWRHSLIWFLFLFFSYFVQYTVYFLGIKSFFKPNWSLETVYICAEWLTATTGTSQVLRGPSITSLCRLWKLNIHISGFHQKITRGQQGCAWHPLLNMIYRDGHAFRNAIQGDPGAEWRRHRAGQTPHIHLLSALHLLSTPRHSHRHHSSLETRDSPPAVRNLFIPDTAQNRRSDRVSSKTGTKNSVPGTNIL